MIAGHRCTQCGGRAVDHPEDGSCPNAERFPRYGGRFFSGWTFDVIRVEDFRLPWDPFRDTIMQYGAIASLDERVRLGACALCVTPNLCHAGVSGIPNAGESCHRRLLGGALE